MFKQVARRNSIAVAPACVHAATRRRAAGLDMHRQRVVLLLQTLHGLRLLHPTVNWRRNKERLPALVLTIAVRRNGVQLDRILQLEPSSSHIA